MMPERSVVTLGVFDGLHRGHASLLQHAGRLGRRDGLPVVLTTFDPHPAGVAGRRRDVAAIDSVERRIDLARAHGADEVVVIPFDAEMAQVSGADFVRRVLVDTLGARHLVVGEGFRFGNRGAGDVALLQRLGSVLGFQVHALPRVAGCSSTRIRELVRAGDVAGAAVVLGRPHRLSGTAASGRIRLADGLLPPSGRYLVLVGGHAGAQVDRACLEGRWMTTKWPVADGMTAIDFIASAERSDAPLENHLVANQPERTAS